MLTCKHYFLLVVDSCPLSCVSLCGPLGCLWVPMLWSGLADLFSIVVVSFFVHLISLCVQMTSSCFSFVEIFHCVAVLHGVTCASVLCAWGY